MTKPSPAKKREKREGRKATTGERIIVETMFDTRPSDTYFVPYVEDVREGLRGDNTEKERCAKAARMIDAAIRRAVREAFLGGCDWEGGVCGHGADAKGKLERKYGVKL